MPTFVIREIAPQDDADVAQVIRTVMPEFGADSAGFALHDEEVDAMSVAYGDPRSLYLVAELDGALIGGAGIAPLVGGDAGVCELRKMYLLGSARGLGIGRALLARLLEEARGRNYVGCYLETIDRMDRAGELYRTFGFELLDAPMGNTGHFGCGTWMYRPL